MAAAVAMLATAFIGVTATPAAAVTDPCGAGSNAIVCENSKPGTSPDTWDIDGAGDDTIQGFGTDISVNVGSSIGFKIKTNAARYTIGIYRTGYYQGLGARFIASVTPSATLPQTQPACVSDLTTELYDCGNWGVSATWTVPSTAVSGVYVATLTRTDTGGKSQIIFIVRNDASHSAVLFQTSDPTWEAYNSYGGSDFYQGAQNGRAYKISYNRPFATRDSVTAHDFYFSDEFAQVQFLEQNGYDMTYAAGVDTDRYGSLLLNHKVFLSVGHDEYWSTGQRANVEAAKNAGVNLEFLSGNEVYWHTRYEASTVEPSSNGYRTLVSYKETWANQKIDPTTTWTGTWRDPRFAPPSAGAGTPENALTGTMFMSNTDDLPITVTAAQGKTRLWRGTSLTTMTAGATTALAPHTVGYESDENIDNGFQPAGLVNLSTTVGATPQELQDFGSVVLPGTTTHHLTLYRAPSGALVFGAGTIQWAWGLNANHDGDGAAADPRMQQAQVNILADMNAQPVTLMSGLVAAAMSTDHTAPTVTVTSPRAGASIANGTNVTVTGTASDVGGVVAGVELSTDGGTSWHPATGTTSWTYSYSQLGNAAQALKVRAIDDSGNYPATPTAIALTVTGPYTVFGSAVPKTADALDTSSVELGLRFTPAADGYVNGVRFYKSAANTGVHVGSLWDPTGARMGQVTFTNETASGWQTALFSAPVKVTAGTKYTISYTAPSGHYSADSYYWAYSSRLSPPLNIPHAFTDPAPGTYGNPGTFPALDYQGANYYVDPLFDTQNSTPPTVTSVWPLAGSTGVGTKTTIQAGLAGGVVASSAKLSLKTVSGTVIAGTSTYDSASMLVTFTPTAALASNTSYTSTIAATGTSGAVLSTGTTWTFTTASAGNESSCPCTIFPSSTLPDVLQESDSPVTVGVKFSANTTGSIVGLRFYKGPGNLGVHTGTLWSSTGTQLASATFSNESASGWQQVYFSKAVAVTAGTQYVASYRSTSGNYSTSAGTFTNDTTNGFLTVPANGAVYSYATGFPTSTSTSNYFMDVVFMTPGAIVTAPPSVVSHSPDSGTTSVATSTTITAVLSADPGNTIPTVAVAAGSTAVAGTTSYNSATKTLTFTPGAALAASTSYSVVISSGSTALVGGTWQFTTAAPSSGGTAYNLISGTPATAAASDSAAVELGMAFTPAQAGSVSAIRFYKGAGNTGTHTGSLWSATGTRLATVTFSGETASGWQTALLATPYALTAGTKYIVSYLAPAGHYSVTANYFTTARSNGPLSADTTLNGRYLYGTGGGFPNSSFQASNYFVDVTFVTASAAPLTVASTAPASGATAVPVTATVNAVMSGESTTGQPTIAITSAAGSIAGSVSYDSSSHTASFQPTVALAASTSYTAKVSIGGTVLTGGTWSFTTAAPSTTTTYSLTPGTPTTAAEDDPSSVELGMAFTTSQAGSVTAIRFYKGAGNSGTHTGSLWLPSGQRVAAVTFAGESATGWQTATLATPYALTVGQTYIVSYFAPNGDYASTAGYFSTARTSGPLTADTNNGRYLYGATSAMPTATWNSTNYSVDVVFTPADGTANAALVADGAPAAAAAPDPSPTPADTPVPSHTPSAAPDVTVGAVAPAGGATDVAPTVSVTAAVTGADAPTARLSITAGSAAVAGTSTYSPSTGLIFAPSTPLAWSKTYTASVFSGTTQIGASWSFTTTAAPVDVTAQSIFAADAVPANVNFDDPSAVQVGTRFTTSVAGQVTSIRFYKGPSNSGTHTGYLWSADGTQLATVSFSGETPSGWQLATLSAPVTLTPGTEYRVGLLSTTGMYSVDLNGLAVATTSGVLSTPANAGSYVYGNGFLANVSPHNYWVDVVFVPAV